MIPSLKEFWLKTWNKLTHGFYREGGVGGRESLDLPLPELSLKTQLNLNLMSAPCPSSLSRYIKSCTFKVFFP